MFKQTRQTLNAGDKLHLQAYTAYKNSDGKVKLRKVKIFVAGQKFDSNRTICGTTHSSVDINYFWDRRKSTPDSVCKKCEKKLRKIVNEVA